MSQHPRLAAQSGCGHCSDPDAGPAPLFFSGGTALGPVARALARRTRHARHIITPFDSGGSSAILRQAFAMPAVGDIRARILALADPSAPGAQPLIDLCATRLPVQAAPANLRQELAALAAGQHALLAGLTPDAQHEVRRLLAAFIDVMPPDLDLAGASLGNLMLAAGYMEHSRHLGRATQDFARLLQARGEVWPVVNANLHLAVRLGDGSRRIGQHRFTGKDPNHDPLPAPIREMELVDKLENPRPLCPHIHDRMRGCIESAALICYPVGSFFSSVLANLLPHGVGAAIRAAGCPKVFLPNPGPDYELRGLTLRDQVACILNTVLRPGDAPCLALNTVLCDPLLGHYPGGIPRDWLAQLNIQLLEQPLLAEPGRLDPERVCDALLELCQGTGLNNGAAAPCPAWGE